MSKKVKRVSYTLDSSGIKSLADSEIKAILRGADELIMTGGRAMLAKILAGSKDKKVLELELDHCPVYGAFKGMTQKEVLARIDWMIQNHYLAIEYDYRLPVLTFTEKGWEIERETYATELLGEFIDAAYDEEYEFVDTLKERNRGMILLLLDKIAETGNKNLIVILDAWKSIECKKVKAKITEVLEVLEKSEHRPSKPRREDTSTLQAGQKWLTIPENIRKKLVRNVFCGSCVDTVQIEKYMIKETKHGLVLEGQCKTCGGKVARVID
ncbi:RQC-minor-1 family DNA-binding protein [Neobacillus sp. PS3-34]|uniref:RQC-minor-1 family DNA-binding protein n=1 Tax=Neobacillus sp. PS3-34 TaxID=3070678 RepID=UPI0027DFA30E|nr:RQC-minor-1 family DNA-binding protein [Neobacillus sp. PS3-34]WML50004.1 RQC-minor-1 family DNA-binding protein [Neobacillus sp. PS3-34]